VTGKVDEKTLAQWRQERQHEAVQQEAAQQRQDAHLAHRQRRLEAARHNLARALPWVLAGASAALAWALLLGR